MEIKELKESNALLAENRHEDDQYLPTNGELHQENQNLRSEMQ